MKEVVVMLKGSPCTKCHKRKICNDKKCPRFQKYFRKRWAELRKKFGVNNG